jgi:hypothetical protein
MKNLLKIISENSSYFLKEVSISTNIKTGSLDDYGWVKEEGRIEIDIDFDSVKSEILMLRIIQIVGMLNESISELYNKCYSIGIKLPQFKTNNLYYLKITVGSERIKVVEKSGFGLIFYKVNEMHQAFSSTLHYFKKKILELEKLSELDKGILLAVFKEEKSSSTTNDLMMVYSKILDSKTLLIKKKRSNLKKISKK